VLARAGDLLAFDGGRQLPRAILDGFEIDAGPAGITLEPAQRFSRNPAIRRPVRRQRATLAPGDDTGRRQPLYGIRGVAGNAARGNGSGRGASAAPLAA
jgi:hypothetical protein